MEKAQNSSEVSSHILDKLNWTEIGLVKRAGKHKNTDNDKRWNSKAAGKSISVVHGKRGKMKYRLHFIFNLKNPSLKLIEAN